MLALVNYQHFYVLPNQLSVLKHALPIQQLMAFERYCGREAPSVI